MADSPVARPNRKTTAVELVPAAKAVLGRLIHNLSENRMTSAMHSSRKRDAEAHLVKRGEDVVSKLDFSDGCVAHGCVADSETSDTLQPRTIMKC
jgi:hypothetical protein